MYTIKFLLTILVVLLISCQNKQQEFVVKENFQNLVVLVKYKAQPSKGKDAVAALTTLINEVKREPNYVKITIHVDPQDDSNILLYEEWSDEGYYNGDHMKTGHLQRFMGESKNFLAGPPEISQWKIKQVFNP